MLRDRQKIIRMFQDLHESPDAKEAAILEENRLSLSDQVLQDFLHIHHMQSDRHASLNEFLDSAFAQRIIPVIERFCNGNKSLAICEIGAGDGFLALALIKSGFSNIDILEPSSKSITGTGFLRDLDAAKQITIYNDLESWYGSNKRYDIIITNACIHHFQNPLFILSQIRLKSHLQTIWLAFWEYFAVDYADTITQLLNHRHATLYGLYEFPYSHQFYRQMFNYAGFRPLEIEPNNSYIEMVLLGKLSHVSIVKKIGRLASKFLCSVHMTWEIYNIFLFMFVHFKRDKIRAMDPFYMAYRAKPIGWAKVKPSFRFLQFKALGTRL